MFLAMSDVTHWAPPQSPPLPDVSSSGEVAWEEAIYGWWDGIKPSSSLPRDTNPPSPVVSDVLDSDLQGSSPQPLQLTAPPCHSAYLCIC